MTMTDTEAVVASDGSVLNIEHTPAYETYETNTKKLSHLLTLVSYSIAGRREAIRHKVVQTSNVIARMQKSVQHMKTVEKTNASVSEKEVLLAEAKTELQVSCSELESINEGLIELAATSDKGRLALQEWLPVMMVAFVEAYLTDAFAYAASLDPTLISKSEQTASLAEVLDATSLDGLADTLRHRWARNFVDDGGPFRWAKRLKGMGAHNFDPEAIRELEVLWGTRHLLVHAGGIVTYDFASRHPELQLMIGDDVHVELEQVRKWSETTQNFVDGTDAYFVNRLRSKLYSATQTCNGKPQ